MIKHIKQIEHKIICELHLSYLIFKFASNIKYILFKKVILETWLNIIERIKL
jgi:hypothetical protein